MNSRARHTLSGVTCAVLGFGLLSTAPAMASTNTAMPSPLPGLSCSTNQGLLPGIPNLGPTGPLGPLGADGPAGGNGSNLPCGLDAFNFGPTGPLGPGGALGSAPVAAPAPTPASAPAP